MVTRKTFIRRTQGGCGAAKAVINDVLSGGVEGASIRNEGAYRNDTPVTEVGQLGFIGVGEVYRDVAISNPLLPPPHAPHDFEGEGKLDVERGRGGGGFDGNGY